MVKPTTKVVKLFSFSGILNKILYRNVGKYIFCWSHYFPFDQAKNAFGNITNYGDPQSVISTGSKLSPQNSFLKYESR